MPAAKSRPAGPALSLERRVERLEAALAATMVRLTANHPFRTELDGHGIDAAGELVAEYEAAGRELRRDAEREQARARLAELEGSS